MRSELLPYLLFGLFVAWILATRFLGKVAPEKAKELVAQGALLLDVRSPGEFASGHLPNATNIPVGSLAGRLASLEPKTRPIVVYCASGMRSASAKRTLLAAGFASVHDLGAMSRWA